MKSAPRLRSTLWRTLVQSKGFDGILRCWFRSSISAAGRYLRSLVVSATLACREAAVSARQLQFSRSTKMYLQAQLQRKAFKHSPVDPRLNTILLQVSLLSKVVHAPLQIFRQLCRRSDLDDSLSRCSRISCTSVSKFSQHCSRETFPTKL